MTSGENLSAADIVDYGTIRAEAGAFLKELGANSPEEAAEDILFEAIFDLSRSLAVFVREQEVKKALHQENVRLNEKKNVCQTRRG